jgi:hypothetical protein
MDAQRMMEQYTGILETTPTEITEDIRRYAKQRSKGNEPVFVPLLPQDSAVPLECYGNVERQVRWHGGEIVYGWLVFEEKNHRFVNFIHHAVWRKPDGTLACVSPQDESTICFVPDPSRPYEGRFIAGRLHCMTDDLNFIAYCSLYNKRLIYYQNMGTPNIQDGVTVGFDLEMGEICREIAADHHMKRSA